MAALGEAATDQPWLIGAKKPQSVDVFRKQATIILHLKPTDDDQR